MPAVRAGGRGARARTSAGDKRLVAYVVAAPDAAVDVRGGCARIWRASAAGLHGAGGVRGAGARCR